ncbi:hypothetical protein D3C87_1984510 [compost metagenome]
MVLPPAVTWNILARLSTSKTSSAWRSLGQYSSKVTIASLSVSIVRKQLRKRFSVSSKSSADHCLSWLASSLS